MMRNWMVVLGLASVLFWVAFGLVVNITVCGPETIDTDRRWERLGHVVELGTLVLTFFGALAIPLVLARASEERSAWIPQTLKDVEDLMAAVKRLASQIADSPGSPMAAKACGAWLQEHRNQRQLLLVVKGRTQAHAPENTVLAESLTRMDQVLADLRRATDSSVFNSKTAFTASPDQVKVAEKCGRQAADVLMRVVAILR